MALKVCCIKCDLGDFRLYDIPDSTFESEDETDESEEGLYYKKDFCFRLALWDFNNTEGCMFVKSSESNDNLKKTFYDCVNLAEEKHASHGQADILTVS